jgi:hypothetical protein
MHPIYGLANVALSAQYQLIAATFSDLPSDYLEEMREWLDQEQRNDEVVAVLHRLHGLFAMRMEIQAALSEYDKIQMLRNAFTWGYYEPVIQRYIWENPYLPRKPARPDDQSYAGLATIITRESELHAVTVLPTNHALNTIKRQANQATTPPADAADSALALAATTAKPAKPHGAGNNRTPFTGPYLYYWSHGLWNHSSQDCSQPLCQPQHQGDQEG